ncbi:PilZ domain-containing protein [Sphingomonas sp. BN140010]|uniref:PilZ domain-containing protein n=1 Tax=Sphingomonas arvum TaxID=2992113 RepID=A0ABT3JDL5_9SPHN|nr:PilZ domain-containing protein [Sphingomonas sp. BN140010]MCW3797166.1 PilZ domain-containing protein [Sphingomonas sp. BN140010]
MSRAPRVDVEFLVMLIAADGHETQVVIRDLSASGFRIEHSDDLQAGDLVTLRLDKGRTVHARIQWSLGNEAGGQFLDRDLLASPTVGAT